MKESQTIDYKDNVIFQMNALNRRVTLQANRLLSGTGLESGTFFTLVGLYQGKNHSLSDYALDFQADRTTVSRAFLVLSKNGYAIQSKRSYRTDKRCAFHIITDKGKQIVEDYFPLLGGLHESLLEDPTLLTIFQLLKSLS